nr:hypothetical protein HAGR004_26480 [Bdellovibrio sp. HAGR004]
MKGSAQILPKRSLFPSETGEPTGRDSSIWEMELKSELQEEPAGLSVQLNRADDPDRFEFG